MIRGDDSLGFMLPQIHVPLSPHFDITYAMAFAYSLFRKIGNPNFDTEILDQSELSYDLVPFSGISFYAGMSLYLSKKEPSHSPRL